MTQWSSGDSLNSFNLNTRGPQPAFNVMAYGALGDASTDDASAIQAASAAARAAGGGVVFFPSVSSYYVCNSTFSMYPGVTYQGGTSGQSGAFTPTTIRRTSGSLPLWAIESASSNPSNYTMRIDVRDLKFHGSSLSGPLTEMRYASLCRFERVFWSMCDGALLRMRAVQDCNFNDCEFEWGGSIAQGVGALSIDSDSNPQFNTNEIRFNDCRWETNTHASVCAQGASSIQAFNLHFHTCKFESTRTTRSTLSFDNVTNLIVDDAYLNVSTAANSNVSQLIQMTNMANPVLDKIQANATSGASVFDLVNSDTGVKDLVIGSIFGAASITRSLINVQNTNAIWFSGPVRMAQGSTFAPSIFSGSANSQIKMSSTTLLNLDITALSISTPAFSMPPGTSGFTGLGLGVAQPLAHLHLASVGLSAGSQGIMLTDVLTNEATKVARVKSSHFTNAEEPLTMIIGSSTSLNNFVRIGGGSASENAATDVELRTGATTMTTAGTNRLTIDSGGTISFNQNRFVSLRTTATSLNSTNMVANELALFVGGGSGATLAIRSGGTIYFFASSVSTIG